MSIRYDYDAAKNEKNIRERGLSFDQIIDFEFETALIEVDNRRNYAEERLTAIGFLEARLHVLVFTVRGDTLRVISFRKANTREVARYEQATRPRTH